MRLPQDKKERTKILLLIGVGGVAALYGVYAGIVKPTLNARKERRANIEELSGKIDKADRIVGRMPAARQENLSAVGEIIEEAERKNYVLKPRLGNYLLSATEVLEQCAMRVGVEIENIREIGISQLPLSATSVADRTFNGYSAGVSLQCGLFSFVDLLREISKANPYICVSSLGITAQGATPGMHKVAFEVQWPVWAHPETAQTLMGQLKTIEKEEASGGGGPDDLPQEGERGPA